MTTNTNAAVQTLRAFIAYCESGGKSNPVCLLPFKDACEAGIPFAETFIHEGKDWAVFVTGDCSPWEHLQLENVGVIDRHADTLRNAPEVADLLSYVRSIDSNETLSDYIHDCESIEEEAELFAEVVRTMFAARIENGEEVSDTEDKLGAIDRLDRAAVPSGGVLSRESYLATLREVVAYALRDIHPESSR